MSQEPICQEVFKNLSKSIEQGKPHSSYRFIANSDVTTGTFVHTFIPEKCKNIVITDSDNLQQSTKIVFAKKSYSTFMPYTVELLPNRVVKVDQPGQNKYVFH